MNICGHISINCSAAFRFIETVELLKEAVRREVYIQGGKPGMGVLQSAIPALRRLREVCEFRPAGTTEGDPHSQRGRERKDKEGVG